MPHSVARTARPPGADIATSARGWLTLLHSVATRRAGHGSLRADQPPAQPRLVRLSPVELYAAYASNMDPAQMALRCPHSPQRGTGWLEGWRLTFGGADIGWEGAMATVVEDEDERVFVVLYEVTEQDARALDSWDGATLGYYSKVKVRVETLDGDVLSWLYVLNAYEGGLPSARYLGILADAAEKAGAPADYVADLRARPCGTIGRETRP